MKIWHKLSQRYKKGSRLSRGSVLILTLFIVTGLSLMIGVLLQATVTETKVNQRAILQLEANNASEATTEYCMSQLELLWNSQANFPSNEFQNNPLTVSPTIASWLWTGSDVDPANITVKTGLVPYPQSIYIDPNDPANAFDPSRGKYVNACDVYVYSTAIAHNAWGTATAYACQALEVRNSPLFANAIFYNMTLEFNPGPAMTISGPVHVNGDMYAVAETGITFSGPITASGNFNVGMEPWPTNWSGTSESTQTGNLVFIPNNTGTTTTPYKGSGSQQAESSYWDSQQTNYASTPYTNWRELSANLWGGNLQTSANDVPNEQITGYLPFVYKVNGTSQDLNYAYAIIEPNQFNPTTNPYHKGVGELDKFERQASLIVKVLEAGQANVTANYTATGVSAVNTTVTEAALNTTVNGFISPGVPASAGTFTVPATGCVTVAGTMTLSNGTVVPLTASGAGTVLSTQPSGHPNAFLVATQSVSNSTATLMDYTPSTTTKVGSGATATYTTTSTRNVGFAWVELDTLESTVDSTGLRTPVYDTSTQILDAYGNVIYPGDVVPQSIAVNASLLQSSNATIGSLITYSPAVVDPGNSSDMWNGIYDGRRGAGVSTLNVNIGQLKNLVDDNAANQSTTSANFFNSGTGQTYVPSNQYNGVVYVEFPQLPGSASRLTSVASGNTTYPGDQITDSVPGLGLVLTNATSTAAATGVPAPNYNDPSLTVNSAGRTPGFTLGTNNCLYVQGNYNADGNINTPETDNATDQQYNSTMPDNVAHPDPSCALAADSITLLSKAWNSRNSKNGMQTAQATEVNAAIVAGIVPSSKSSATQESGGAHNFPRFLENWSSVPFRYRGSLVCLFESEIGNQPWGSSYYSPPNREFGFYNQFAKGFYPPGTPSARSYYRVGFTLLTKAQYVAATAGLH